LGRKLRDERMKSEKEEDYICEDVMNDGMKGWNCNYDVIGIGGNGIGLDRRLGVIPFDFESWGLDVEKKKEIRK
jgi:hypothetical protein